MTNYVLYVDYKYISEFRFRISEKHNIGSQQVVKNQNGDYFR